MVKVFMNENNDSVVIDVISANEKSDWLFISLYRNSEKDELDLTKEEAKQLRDALTEFLGA